MKSLTFLNEWRSWFGIPTKGRRKSREKFPSIKLIETLIIKGFQRKAKKYKERKNQGKFPRGQESHAIKFLAGSMKK